MTFKMVRSFLMQAMRATISGFLHAGENFLEYGLSVVRTRQNGFALPLPLDSG